ncbi:Amidinotransferase [Pseudonocardia thermophila]|uniref:arginine deiminase n=1 Tax=Pseudonocardia thermophila TaxID=1848 RepID=A0A1M7AD10_PSETH|nr:Amidinotransferase [Pseudonocardia thermophila]
MSEPVSAGYGVHSEVGRLRKVLVCAPGLAHRRLTPTNCDDLLFDDVLWVENAQRDHAAFTAELRARGVEVVELHELLAETLAVPGAKDWLLDRKITRTRWASDSSSTPAPTWTASMTAHSPST